MKKRKEADLDNEIKTKQNIMEKEFKTKEEKLNLEISQLKLQLSKMRDEDNKEESDLKRKK